MATFGTNIRLTASRDLRESVRAFYRTGLRAVQITPMPDLDVFRLPDGFQIGVYFVRPEEALSREAAEKGAWLEFVVDDEASAAAELIELGAEPVEYADKERRYLRAPGGQIFRLAAAFVLLLAIATGCDDGDAAPAPVETLAVVRGRLASTDMDQARAAHDAIAQQGEQQARDAGDIAHDVLLGTTYLDSIENEFLALDRWTDADAMRAFYGDPEFQQAFATLFAEPPTIEYFALAPDWEVWGDMDAGETFDPYFFHLALGTLAEADTAAAQAAHDQVASGGKQPSIDAGNVGHIVYLGLDDPQRFVAVDIWSVGDPIEPFYSNPMFRQAFEPLFASVTEPVYQSSDWHQW